MSIFPQKLPNSATSLLTIKRFDLLVGAILIFSVPSTKKLLTTGKLYQKLLCTKSKGRACHAVLSFEVHFVYAVKWLSLLEWHHAKYMPCLTWFYNTCTNISSLVIIYQCLFGIMVSMTVCHPRGPGFDSWLYHRHFSGCIESGMGSTQPREDNWVTAHLRSSIILAIP